MELPERTEAGSGCVELTAPTEDCLAGVDAAARELYHQLNFIADIDSSAQAVAETLRAVQSDDLDDTFAKVASQLLQVADDVAAGCEESISTCQVVDEALVRSVSALTKINEAVEELDSAGKRIQGIVSAIATFTRQTEMLSVNAQIEAARAGEAGLGFAVVAGEVGELADRIRQESDEIEVAVGAMQSRCNEVATLVRTEVQQNGDLLPAVERMREVNEALGQSGMQLPESVARLDQFLDPLCQAREAAGHNGMILVSTDNVARNLRSIHGALRDIAPAARGGSARGIESFIDLFTDILVEGREVCVENILDDVLDKGYSASDLLDAVGKAVQAANMRQKQKHVSVGEYYLNFLAVESAIAHLEPLMETATTTGMTVVLGNAKGDYHSLGRSMVGAFLRASGIEVVDVGLGAEVSQFVNAVKQSGALVIGVSSLLVESAKQITKIREALDREGLQRVKIVAGGACFVIDREFYREVRADFVATMASDMVILVHQIYQYEPMRANEITVAERRAA